MNNKFTEDNFLSVNDKKLALLIDPDKINTLYLDALSQTENINCVDYVFIGSSLLFNDFEQFVQKIKSIFSVPVIIFPGNMFQISSKADGFLLLSLISGRNPEWLIGHHVMAAPKLYNAGIPILPTGYMLFDCGALSSVQYFSNSYPLPNNKADLAIATAMAGKMLGLKHLYLEAGSGAPNTVNTSIVESIKTNVDIPIIVGGGISTIEQANNLWQAGANLIVAGNALEKNPKFLSKLINARLSL